MPSYYYQAERLTNTRWGTQAVTGIDGLSNPQEQIVVVLPEANYTINNEPKSIIASFHVSREMGGTPREVFETVVGNRNNSPGAGELIKYNDGTNTWYLGKEAGFVNNVLAYIILPTDPVKFIISIDLMEKGSRMAKFIKEKIIPSLNYRTIRVEVNELRTLIPPTKRLFQPITQDNVSDLLLEHIDDFA